MLSRCGQERNALGWPHAHLGDAAIRPGCKHGHVDQVGRAVQALRDAEAGVGQAQERARQLVADARARVADARDGLAAAVVAEYEDGARVSDLAARAGRNRETIRRVLRAAGFQAET